MKSLPKFIAESYDDYLKLSAKDKKKMLELDLEYGKLMLICRYETYIRNIDNLDEAWEEFEERHIKNKETYFPEIKHKKLEYEKYDLENKINKLINNFHDLDCILSRYYIEVLESALNRIETIKSVENNTYELSDRKKHAFKKKDIDKALEIVRTHPFVKSPNEEKYKHNKTGDVVINKIKDTLKELGYDWEVIINNNMPPRMGVNPEKTFRIRETAKFSDVDIESLIAHEIKGHVQRRYWGYQTGLFLFVFGLDGRNLFDEGLAIWNSKNLVESPKPNFLANIAFSYIACNYCGKYEFCEAFDKLKELYKDQHISDKKIFKQLMRAKRSTGRTDLPGFWFGDTDYFMGFNIVDEMTTEEREKIMKWNVGQSTYYLIPTFEKFIKVNEFEPISNERLNKIKNNYKDLPK